MELNNCDGPLAPFDDASYMWNVMSLTTYTESGLDLWTF